MDQSTFKERDIWRARREAMERAPRGRPSLARLRRGYYASAELAGRAIAATPFYRHAVRSALNLRRREFELAFAALPAAFHGYRVLHLSDLHIDNPDGMLAAAVAAVRPVEADLCVLTGDIRDDIRAPIQPVIDRVGRLARAIRAPDGILAVLGNHDCAAMVEPLEALGLTVLVNESRVLYRGARAIRVTGVDDVHRFYTPAAREALRAPGDGFRLALAHSPEIAHVAADAGHHLYLCGHTHGGQVCWPGGRPIITRLKRHRRYARGLWRHGGMTGYTSSGVGVSTLPIRVNSRGEVAVITLHRDS